MVSNEEKIVIKFKNVTKTYKLYKNEKERLMGFLTKHDKGRKKRSLKNVSFDIKKG